MYAELSDRVVRGSVGKLALRLVLPVSLVAVYSFWSVTRGLAIMLAAFLVFIALRLVRRRPHSPGLMLTAHRFTVGCKAYDFEQRDAFRAVRFPLAHVTFNDDRPTGVIMRSIAAMNRRFGGPGKVVRTIPSVFEARTQELADLLNAYRARAVGD
jgi:hypothetical protein